MTTYTFNINGLAIGNRFFDPSATCDLLQNLELIEGFEIDNNGEPVILYTDSNNPQGYNGCTWADFVKSFYISETLASLIFASLVNREVLNQVTHLLNVAA